MNFSLAILACFALFCGTMSQGLDTEELLLSSEKTTNLTRMVTSFEEFRLRMKTRAKESKQYEIMFKSSFVDVSVIGNGENLQDITVEGHDAVHVNSKYIDEISFRIRGRQDAMLTVEASLIDLKNQSLELFPESYSDVMTPHMTKGTTQLFRHNSLASRFYMYELDHGNGIGHISLYAREGGIPTPQDYFFTNAAVDISSDFKKDDSTTLTVRSDSGIPQMYLAFESNTSYVKTGVSVTEKNIKYVKGTHYSENSARGDHITIAMDIEQGKSYKLTVKNSLTFDARRAPRSSGTPLVSGTSIIRTRGETFTSDYTGFVFINTMTSCKGGKSNCVADIKFEEHNPLTPGQIAAIVLGSIFVAICTPIVCCCLVIAVIACLVYCAGRSISKSISKQYPPSGSHRNRRNYKATYQTYSAPPPTFTAPPPTYNIESSPSAPSYPHQQEYTGMGNNYPPYMSQPPSHHGSNKPYRPGHSYW